MIRLHIKICEIRNFQNNRISENPNIYFTLKLENDDKAECHKTRIINSNDHLIWNEEIDIYASNSNDSLIILIYFNDSKRYQFQYPVNTWIVWGPMEKKEENINNKDTFFGKFIFEVQSKQVLNFKIEKPVKYSHVKFSMSDNEKRIMRAQNLILAARNLDEDEVRRLTSRKNKLIDEDTLYFIDSDDFEHTIFDEMAEIYDMITDISQKKICLNIIKLIVECRQYTNPKSKKYLRSELGNEGLFDKDGLFNKMCENYNFRPNSRIIVYPIGKGIVNNWNLDVLRIYLRMFYRFGIGFGIKHHGSLIDIWSPIEVCIKLNNLDAAKELIKYGCKLPSEYRDEIKDSPIIFKLNEIFYPQTAIMRAVIDENIKSLTELVENPKVDINFVYDEKNDPKTLLSYAVKYNDIKIIDILLSKNADPNFIDVLKFSIKNKNKELIDKLCNHGMNMNTAVYVALKLNRIKREFWEYLFSKGADINYRDKEITDDSLLRLAVEKRDEYIIDKLHENGSNMAPALSYAILSFVNFEESEQLFFKKLLRYGADINYYDSNRITSTPLICSVESKKCNNKVVDFLIKNGASVNMRDSRKKSIGFADEQPTAIYYAAKKSKTLAVRSLLDAGADPNLKGTGLPTPLHVSIGDLLIMEYLIEKGAKVNRIDMPYNGRTPIHYAALYLYPSSIEILLNNGAKCSTDTDGYTPFDLLYKHRDDVPSEQYNECKRLLRDAGFYYNKYK